MTVETEEQSTKKVAGKPSTTFLQRAANAAQCYANVTDETRQKCLDNWDVALNLMPEFASFIGELDMVLVAMEWTQIDIPTLTMFEMRGTGLHIFDSNGRLKCSPQEETKRERILPMVVLGSKEPIRVAQAKALNARILTCHDRIKEMQQNIDANHSLVTSYAIKLHDLRRDNEAVREAML